MDAQKESETAKTGPLALAVVSLAALVVGLSAPQSWAAEDDGAVGTAERTRRLVQELGDRSYRIREQAQKELIGIGPPAIDSLEEASRSEDAEVRQRAQRALAEIRRQASEAASRAMKKNLLWKLPIASDIAGSPVMAGDAVLFLGQDSKLRAANAATGRLLWQFPADVASAPVVAGQTVYVRDLRGRLLASDAITGKLRPEVDATRGYGIPAVAGGVIYLPGPGEALRALDAETGKPNWQVSLSDGPGGALAPLVAGKVVYAATRDGKVHALDRASGKQRWTAAPGIEGQTYALALHEGLVIVRSDAGLHAIGAETGKSAWSFSVPTSNMVAVLQGVPAGMVSRVIVVNGQRIGFTSCWGAGDSSAVVYDGLICLAVGDRLIAVDAETGKEKWTYKPSLKTQQSPDGRRGVIVMRARAARIQAVQVRMLVAGNAGLAGVGSGGLSGAAVVNGVIYFGSREGLHALEKKSRSEIWRFDTPLPVSGRPIVANGVIYFHTTRGMLAGLTRTAPGGRGDLAPQQRAGLYAVRLKAKD